MYRPVILPYFFKTLKNYSKKHPRLKDSLVESLDGFQKTTAVSLGHGLYKVRLKSPDINKGKSQSFRLIVLIMEFENYIIPVALYFKGDKRDLSKKEIVDDMEMILFELKSWRLLNS